MGGGGSYEIRTYDESQDRSQLEAFHCARLGEKWSRSAEQVIQDAPSALEGGTKCRILVADDDSTVVGAVVFGPEPGFDDRDIIYSLGVLIERQQQGIGTRLKQTVMSENAASDPPRLVVSQVHRNNYRMICLNNKLGVGADRDPSDGEYLLTAVRVEPE